MIALLCRGNESDDNPSNRMPPKYLKTRTITCSLFGNMLIKFSSDQHDRKTIDRIIANAQIVPLDLQTSVLGRFLLRMFIGGLIGQGASCSNAQHCRQRLPLIRWVWDMCCASGCLGIGRSIRAPCSGGHERWYQIFWVPSIFVEH